MKTAIVRGVANVVTKIDEGLKSAGFGSISEILADKGAKMEAALSKFAEMIPPMIKTAKTLYDTLKPYATLLAGLAGSIGTLMLVNKVNAAFKAWREGTEALSIAQAILNKTMLSNPFVAILTAVVGLVTAFIYLWKTNEGCSCKSLEFHNGIFQQHVGWHKRGFFECWHMDERSTWKCSRLG